MNSREQFEAAYDEYTCMPAGTAYSLRMANSYRTPKISKAWYWWRASRADVVVELPEGMTIAEICEDAWRPEQDNEQLISRPDTVRAIEATGLKVAP